MRNKSNDEYFNQNPKPRHSYLKRKAIQYLGFNTEKKLSKTEAKKLRIKTNKLKVSEKKARRHFGHEFFKQVSYVFKSGFK